MSKPPQASSHHTRKKSSAAARRRYADTTPISARPSLTTNAKPSSASLGSAGWMTDDDNQNMARRIVAQLGAFWPGGVLAMGGVVMALYLHVNGLTQLSPTPIDTVATIDAGLLADMDTVENEGVELVDRWEKAHEQNATKGVGAMSDAESHVATYIARSYRLSTENAQQLVAWAVEIGEGFDVDPLLILSVAAIESSFNPKAKSKAGAEGLMQVMTRVHLKRFQAFGGAPAALEAYPSLVVGTSILSGYIRRTGSVSRALKWYCGAANQDTDGGYAERVMKERSRMEVAAAGDSATAVQLSRTKKTGSGYESSATARAKVKQLGFDEWRRFGGAIETKMATQVSVGKEGTTGKIKKAVLSVETNQPTAFTASEPSTQKTVVSNTTATEAAKTTTATAEIKVTDDVVKASPSGADSELKAAEASATTSTAPAPAATPS